jgi:hypothetical protein
VRKPYPLLVWGTALFGIVYTQPLPPDLREQGGAVAALGAPVLALEDWFDAAEGLGMACADRTRVARGPVAGVVFSLPRCFLLEPGGEAGLLRLRDPDLGVADASLQVLAQGDPRRASLEAGLGGTWGTTELGSANGFSRLRLERTSAEGVLTVWLARGPRAALVLGLLVPGPFALSPKLRLHRAELQAAVMSAQAEPAGAR